MLRFLLAGFLILACLIALACEPATKGLKQSVVRADEASAIATLHTIASAQRNYFASTGEYGSFQQLSSGEFLDSRFNSDKPEVNNYVFSMDVSAQKFSCNADPLKTAGQAGRHLHIDSESADVHVNPEQSATASDPPIQP
jgi:Tfp pilus assembly protein PilE